MHVDEQLTRSKHEPLPELEPHQAAALTVDNCPLSQMSMMPAAPTTVSREQQDHRLRGGRPVW